MLVHHVFGGSTKGNLDLVLFQFDKGIGFLCLDCFRIIIPYMFDDVRCRNQLRNTKTLKRFGEPQGVFKSLGTIIDTRQ